MLTDPDARSMATHGRGSGVAGYNVQAAIDAQHHLIVPHAVINKGHDRHQLAAMAVRARRYDANLFQRRRGTLQQAGLPLSRRHRYLSLSCR